MVRIIIKAFSNDDAFSVLHQKMNNAIHQFEGLAVNSHVIADQTCATLNTMIEQTGESLQNIVTKTTEELSQSMQKVAPQVVEENLKLVQAGRESMSAMLTEHQAKVNDLLMNLKNSAQEVQCANQSLAAETRHSIQESIAQLVPAISSAEQELLNTGKKSCENMEQIAQNSIQQLAQAISAITDEVKHHQETLAETKKFSLEMQNMAQNTTLQAHSLKVALEELSSSLQVITKTTGDGQTVLSQSVEQANQALHDIKQLAESIRSDANDSDKARANISDAVGELRETWTETNTLQKNLEGQILDTKTMVQEVKRTVADVKVTFADLIHQGQSIANFQKDPRPEVSHSVGDNNVLASVDREGEKINSKKSFLRRLFGN